MGVLRGGIEQLKYILKIVRPTGRNTHGEEYIIVISFTFKDPVVRAIC